MGKPDISEIDKFTKWLFNDYNGERIRQQEEDQKYYDDDFEVKIVTPFHVVRTGSAARIVDNIVGHIETANPQVFRKNRNNSLKERESNLKVGIFLNNLAKHINPEIVEATWNLNLRGDAVYQADFNKNAYEKQGGDYIYTGKEMPVIITAPDPLTVCCFPYDALIPAKVAKKFSVDARIAQSFFPDKKLPEEKKHVDYSAYYESLWKYFSIGGVSIDSDEIMANVLKFCPFVHFYSGFGKKSPTGKPETLAVGRLRKIRGILVEECEMESRIDSVIGLYANPNLTIEQTSKDGEPADAEALKKMVIGPGQTQVIPFGYKATIYTPDVATAQLFAHLAQIKSRLGLEDPPIMSGVSSNSRVSGRQEDIEFEHIKARYAKQIKNHEIAIATVLGMALKILYEQPQALPITTSGVVVDENGKKAVKELTISKEDIDGYFDCEVKLNPEEAIENDRNFMKHKMLLDGGRESWRRFLIEGAGMTEAEADDVISETLAEQAILNSPLARAAREQEAIKQMGMERYIEEVKQDATMQQNMQQQLQNYQPKQATSRPSEATNPQAVETVRRLIQETPYGARRSPGQ